jgi:dTMP kinase
MDIHLADNLFDSFIDYQSKIGMQFSQLAKEYGFITLDAGRPVTEVFSDLQSHIRKLLEDQHPIIDIDL